MINAKYSGEYTVAIVRDHGRHFAPGTYEADNQRDIMNLLGIPIPKNYSTHPLKPLNLPFSKAKVRRLEKIALLHRLLSFSRHADYQVLAVYQDVGEACTEVVLGALDDLNSGREVDLDNLLS